MAGVVHAWGIHAMHAYFLVCYISHEVGTCSKLVHAGVVSLSLHEKIEIEKLCVGTHNRSVQGGMSRCSLPHMTDAVYVAREQKVIEQ